MKIEISKEPDFPGISKHEILILQELASYFLTSPSWAGGPPANHENWGRLRGPFPGRRRFFLGTSKSDNQSGAGASGTPNCALERVGQNR